MGLEHGMTGIVTSVDSFFFADPATTELYTFPTRRSSDLTRTPAGPDRKMTRGRFGSSFSKAALSVEDRKSTRLNSSHSQISYAVFCLKKKTTCGSLRRDEESS